MYTLFLLVSLLGTGKPWDPPPACGRGSPQDAARWTPSRLLPGLVPRLPLGVGEGRALRRRVRSAIPAAGRRGCGAEGLRESARSRR